MFRLNLQFLPIPPSHCALLCHSSGPLSPQEQCFCELQWEEENFCTTDKKIYFVFNVPLSQPLNTSHQMPAEMEHVLLITKYVYTTATAKNVFMV